tara:strand:- start:9865 stop:10104 length:240 start_codon:yes stop_codon:yes gene_type:complete
MLIKREIGEKGQIVVPKDIRDYLGLNIGSRVIFEVKDDKIFIKKEDNPEEIVEDFFNTPKIKKKISVKDIKKMYGESYG